MNRWNVHLHRIFKTIYQKVNKTASALASLQDTMQYTSYQQLEIEVKMPLKYKIQDILMYKSNDCTKDFIAERSFKKDLINVDICHIYDWKFRAKMYLLDLIYRFMQY